MPPTYDFIFAGAGCAGLSLVYQILHNPSLQNRRILLIDPNSKTANDRTWCFWTDESTLFDPIIRHVWQQIEVQDFEKKLPLKLEKLRYQLIRGIDFYETVRKKISEFPQIEWLQARVETIEQKNGGVEVSAEGKKYTATWCFDSRFRPQDFSSAATAYHFLVQHFKGYVIRSEKPVFEPKTVKMFDFRTPQIEGVHFFYLLPFSETEGLVEFTVFSKKLLPEGEYDQLLKKYLSEKLGLGTYEILETEWGVIPMTDFRFVRQPTPNVMNIGTNGGLSRGSTGYTFLRIQKDSQKIVENLEKKGNPFYQNASQWQFEMMDSLILNLMHRRGETVSALFMQLFGNNPVERVLRFLENGTSSLENLQIMASVPPMPFFGAIFDVLRRKFVK